MSIKIGSLAEEEAKKYLLSQGLRFVASNYRSRLGEIDLIMLEKNTLVFIEVRARKSNAFGGASASVTKSKKQKIMKTASHYLLINHFKESKPIRFDVMALEGQPPQIRWIQNAFGFDF